MNLNSSSNQQSSSTSLLPGSELGPRVVSSEDSALAMVSLEVKKAEVRVLDFPVPPTPSPDPGGRAGEAEMREGNG